MRDALGIHFFSLGCFCLSCWILGFFAQDGFVISLSGSFGPPCIPLGISVESSVLEIVGLDS